MIKPNGYDEQRASGDFTPVRLGGHYCTIKRVAETKSKTGKDMIVVCFDFDSNDDQAGYFMESFKNDVREEKKWPFQGTKYIMVNDYQDASKTSRQFKTFCTCVESSNSGFSIQWGENWGSQFVGKKIGAVYGEEENEWNGKQFMRPTIKYFCKTDSVANAAIPEPKYLLNHASKANASATNDFMNVGAGDMDEIPF